MAEPQPIVRVRRARREDARSVAKLSGQLGYPARPTDILRRLRLFGKSCDHAVYVARTSNGPVIGWVHVFVHRLLESEPRAEIGGLVVAEDFRGRGAGQMLLERAERWARQKGMTAAYLRSNIVRKESHRFYQKRGYRIIKTQYAFLKSLSPRFRGAAL